MVRFIPKQFAENSTTSVVFGSFQEQGGNVGDGTISSDPATLQGGTAWPLGWSAATEDFFKIPRGEEMEGLERVLSAAIIQQFKDGLTFWQSEMPVTQYQTIVQYQTGSDLPKLYVNITGTSTSTPPDSDTTNWFMFFDTAQVSANVSLTNSPYTTNRILEIPQDIKLELNNGTLTLKAGSKVYVPNGFEQDGTTPKFDVVTIASDLSQNYSGWGTQKRLLTYNTTKNGLEAYELDTQTASGDTAPTVSYTYITWYDTANNLVKYTGDSGLTWTSGGSLPLAIFSGADIILYQVFNGFGYIGSTVFALPGVKVQGPDGKNEDGTYKNGILTVSSVSITSVQGGWGSFDLFIGPDLKLNIWPNIINGSAGTRYNDKTNYYEVYDLAGAKWVPLPQALAIAKVKADTTSPYKIASFEPYTVDSVLNSSLSNLSAAGEAHFANPDMSNLSANGLTKIFKTGMIIPWGGTSSNKPDGWLVCDGSAVSRETYADLFAIIGTAYGAGNGTTTFNLPNFTDKWAGGNGNGYLSAGLPNINGSIAQGLYCSSSSVGTGAFKSNLVSTSYIGHAATSGYTGGFDFSASRSSSIYGLSSTVQPPTCKSYWLIKY